MTLTLPRAKDLFGGDPTLDESGGLAERHQKFVGSLDMGTLPSTANGSVELSTFTTDGGGSGKMLTKARGTQLADDFAGSQIAKALDPSVLASIQQAIAAEKEATQRIVKDFTLTNPLATGYVAYDLQAPAKLLYPKPTPLRNKITRVGGIGTSSRYKKIKVRTMFG